jgi:hypothetical protein
MASQTTNHDLLNSETISNITQSSKTATPSKYELKTFAYKVEKKSGFQLMKRNFVTKYRISAPAYLKIGGREIICERKTEDQKVDSEEQVISDSGLIIKLKKKKAKVVNKPEESIIEIKDIVNYLNDIVPETKEQTQLTNIGSQIFQSQMQVLELDKDIQKGVLVSRIKDTPITLEQSESDNVPCDKGKVNIKDGFFTMYIESLVLSFIGAPPKAVIVEETYVEIPAFEAKVKEDAENAIKEKVSQEKYLNGLKQAVYNDIKKKSMAKDGDKLVKDVEKSLDK